jgi:hypothetical protein
VKGSDEGSVPAAAPPIFGRLRQFARNRLLYFGYLALKMTRE